ncbi:hypothetical protein N9L89_07285 [Gammaproteobacteria bacterium]|nr:hypothetical protein [Gammaproteobacteria bacterium]
MKDKWFYLAIAVVVLTAWMFRWETGGIGVQQSRYTFDGDKIQIFDTVDMIFPYDQSGVFFYKTNRFTGTTYICGTDSDC